MLRRRLARRIVAVGAGALLVTGVWTAYSYRQGRLEFVALLDARTGRTIAKLSPEWRLIGESSTSAAIERAGSVMDRAGTRRIIFFPSAAEESGGQSTIGPSFALGGIPPPVDHLAWWFGPPDLTGNPSFAQVDSRSEGCFSLTLLSTIDGLLVWRTISDFGRPADTSAFAPPTVLANVPPPLAMPPVGANKMPPPPVASNSPPPTKVALISPQAPDGTRADDIRLSRSG
jgi:hypothetical protein